MKRLPHPVQMVLVYVLCDLLDILSSLRLPAGFIEVNPFTRYPETYAFWPWHAFISSAVGVCELFIMAGVFYMAGRAWDRRVGLLAASIPWCYSAAQHLEAVWHNVLIHMGLYVA